MKKRLAKMALGALTGLMPVFIAACYGVRYMCLNGRVVDEKTGEGINGIFVSCLVSNGPAEFSLNDATSYSADGDDGETCMELDEDTFDGDTQITDAGVEPPGTDEEEPAAAETFSLPVDGYFELRTNGDLKCQRVRFTDVDGAANGAYRELTVAMEDFEEITALARMP